MLEAISTKEALRLRVLALRSVTFKIVALKILDRREER